ncbi:MAG: PAS domain-containing protein [Bradymonadaceae bacterium]|nr:PAS domain-containing protein [Lujinxingiaceae bacterium]
MTSIEDNQSITLSSSELDDIHGLLRNDTGHDLSHYKPATAIRRIQQRMKVHRFANVTEYLDYFRMTWHERQILYKELLIGVTQFFRDPEAFERLKEVVALRFVGEAPARAQSFRVWVPGCSTGEEAYSLAIVLLELMAENGINLDIKIFASDVNAAAIQQARDGLYDASLAESVSPERLLRFFSRQGEMFRIRRDVREMVIFAVQDVLCDVPFSKIDLLSCHNLLIYLNATSQQKLLSMFHYVLKAEGILFLGSSESAGEDGKMFQARDKRYKIFDRKQEPPAADASWSSLPRISVRLPSVRAGTSWMADVMRNSHKGELIGQIERQLLDGFTPPSAIVTRAGEVVYIHGSMGRYLETVSSKVELNLLAMAHSSLRTEILAGIQQVLVTNQRVVRGQVVYDYRGTEASVDLVFFPIARPDRLPGSWQDLIIVVFLERQPAPLFTVTEIGDAPSESSQGALSTIQEVTHELELTRAYLHHAVSQLETVNRDLPAINEDLQSNIEELQTTNEELEASMAELKAVNEQLEKHFMLLKSKTSAQARAQDDLKNLTMGLEIAALFLDNELQIKRLTPFAQEILMLDDDAIGRSIASFDLSHCLRMLADDIQRVIDTLVRSRRDIEIEFGRWFRVVITPYRISDHTIDGALLTLTDVTWQKQRGD